MNIVQLKKDLKNSKYFGHTYAQMKYIRDESLRRVRLFGRYTFESRKKDSDKLCIVLAGYKEFLYPSVFGRLWKYAPEDMDICILTSGLYSESVSRICAEKGWSYLSTKWNNISLIQNIAIHLFPKAEYIFKLDEDIFICKGFFEKMMCAYKHAQSGIYDIGVIAPLIPLNSYGNRRILEKLDLVEKYTELFGKPKYILDTAEEYYRSPEAAKFYWGEGGYVPSIDEMDTIFSNMPLEERPCAIRFCIGAIMFTREFWNDFGQYPISVVGGFKAHLGSDEEALCKYCCNKSRTFMVTENVVVGHFGFAQQTTEMKEYYLNYPERFMAPEAVEENI